MTEPKKPRSKTLIVAVVVGLVLVAVALYYIAAIGTSESNDVVLLTQ